MRLKGKRIAFLIEEGFEDLEFWVTVMRLREEGAVVTIVGGDGKHYRGKNGLAASADVNVEQVDAAAFDAVVVPGGWAPDKMRRSAAVKRLVREMSAAGKI
ncbi:MAG TPA: DJ-1/PfpI family protein, partial [Holophaga sp.]|nr:DJ-1/PfpI family protein [Holophaga sp.]